MVDKLEAVEVTQADRDALWAAMVEEIRTWPRGFDEETDTQPKSDEDWSSYHGGWVAKAALRALAAQRATPALALTAAALRARAAQHDHEVG